MIRSVHETDQRSPEPASGVQATFLAAVRRAWRARRAGSNEVRGSRSISTLRGGLALMALLGLWYVLDGADNDGAVGRGERGPARPSLPATAPGSGGTAEDRASGRGGPDAAADLDRITTSLGPGGTLSAALERLGLSPDERHRGALALGREIDLTRLPASTGLCAAVDELGRVDSVSVRAEPDRFVRWRPASGASGVEVVDVPVRTAVRHAEGKVVRSVRQALDDLAWAEELTLAFADIFQWDVDLLVDPRPGDRVRVVYEVHSLGEVPVDLPSFGGAASSPGEPLRLGRVLAASYDGSMASSEAYWVEGATGEGSYYDGEGNPLRKTFLKSPLNYRRISSSFSRGRRHPITRKVVPHHGVDFAAAPGTPVVAAADGRIVSAGWAGPLGRAVRVRHGSEYATVYGHLRGFARGIRVGAEVSQNQVVGYVGSTGRATGPHLHYTLIHRGRPIDPMKFRNPPAQPLPPELVPHHRRAKLAWAPLLDRTAVTAGPAYQAGTESASLRRGI
jgi:murein DD-endopeptidase MepM/ murein hydrolase activator NlpD